MKINLALGDIANDCVSSQTIQFSGDAAILSLPTSNSHITGYKAKVDRFMGWCAARKTIS